MEAERRRKKEDPFPLIVLRGGIEFTQWFVEWCERIEAQILAADASGTETQPKKRT